MLRKLRCRESSSSSTKRRPRLIILSSMVSMRWMIASTRAPFRCE